MADSFSWTDTFRSCLPCIRPYPSDTTSSGGGSGAGTLIFDSTSNAINRIPRARPDELQGLLVEDDSDALSLHSNVGRGRQNGRHLKKKKRRSNPNNGNGGLRLFGYDLFGRRAAAIQLPDDTEDALYNTNSDDAASRGPNPPRLGATTSIGTTSTFTFDSTSADPDASPLDLPSSSSDILILAASRQRDEEERKLQEQERKRLKKEKKELKKLAKVLAEAAERRGDSVAMGGLDGVEFEGFQGSGSGLVLGDADGKYPKMPTPSFFSPRKGTSKSTGTSSVSGSARSVPVAATRANEDEEDDQAADLDGAMYSRPSTRQPPNPTPGSRARSQSYSSHSHSNREYTPRLRRAGDEEESHSQPGSRRQHSLVRQDSPQPTTPTSPFPSVPTPPPQQALFSSDLPHDKEKKHRKHGHKSKKSKSSKGSSSTTTRSRSQSVSQTAYSASGSEGHGEQVLNGTIETGLGFFDVEDFNQTHSHHVPSPSPSPLRSEFKKEPRVMKPRIQRVNDDEPEFEGY